MTEVLFARKTTTDQTQTDLDTAEAAIAVLQASLTPALTAEYIVAVASSALSAERVLTDTATVAWDAGTAAQMKATVPAFTGDVTRSANGTVQTIADDAVTNAKAANMAQSTIKGRAAGAGTGDPTDLTATQARAVLELVGLINIAAASGTLDLAGGQLKFPASQNASTDVNTLDDYEEGTYTPTIGFTTAGDQSIAYTVNTGTYVKIGRMVFASFDVLTSTFTHTTASGALRLSTLPFTSATLTTNNFGGSLWWQGITKANYTSVVANLPPTVTYIEFIASGSAQAAATLGSGDFPTGGTVRLTGHVVYIAAT